MKTKLLSVAFLLMSTTLFSQNNITLSGQITNPTGDSVFLLTNVVLEGKYKQITLGKSSLSESGSFELSAMIDSTIEVTFTDGNESAPMILSPNDAIKMSLNTSFFDETVSYTGKGSEKNNAVMTLYLIEENMNSSLFENMDKGDTITLFSKFNTSHDNYIALVKDYKNNISDFGSRADKILKSSEVNKKQIKAYVASEIAFKAKMSGIENQPAIDFEGIDLDGKD